jgi:hypothetical protein
VLQYGDKCEIIKTMNYETAKQLKDAGFPKELSASGDDGVYPTLSELIEATHGWVGEINGEYIAGKDFINYTELTAYRGSTPEEAVAQLWLALNSKENK